MADEPMTLRGAEMANEEQKILDILAPLGAKSIHWEGQFAQVRFSPGYDKNRHLFETGRGVEINGYPIEPIWEKAPTMREEIAQKPLLHAVMGLLMLVVIGFFVALLIALDMPFMQLMAIVGVCVVLLGGYCALSIWLGRKARSSQRIAYRNLG